ncbi:MAG: hypothetical protein HY744_07640 [Deltaproteobacteria bacterium]|nr:hypothetical protein [Deltaproteobacteria bacterium]
MGHAGGGERATLGGVFLATLIVASAGGCSGGEGVEPPLGHGGRADGRPAFAAEPSWQATAALAARVPRAARLAERDGRFVLHPDAAEASARLAASAPASAGGALRLERPGASGIWLEVSALGRHAVPGRIEDGAVVYRRAEPASDVIVALGTNRVEELRVLYGPEAPATARYLLHPGPGVSAVRERSGRIEVLDGSGRVAWRTTRAIAIDARGTRRLVSLRLETAGELPVIAAAARLAGLRFPVVVDPEWVSGPEWPAELLVALGSVRLEHDSVADGDVAAIDKAAQPTLGGGGFEALLENGAVVTGSLRANQVRLKAGAVVAGEAGYNVLDNKGTIKGPCMSPLALPLAISVPAFPAFSAGVPEVVLEGGQKLSLVAGSYGAVKLKPGQKDAPTMLSLSGGVYELGSLDVSNRARVECQSPCELRVAEQAELGNEAYLGPAGQSGPADVELFVAGIKQGGKDKGVPIEDAVVIGAGSELRARVFAPNGTVWVKQESHGKGTFVAEGIRVGHGTEIEKEAPVVVEPDCPAYCALLVGAACPGGPANEQQCASECEAALGEGFCQEQYEALVVCALTKKSVSCDEQGKPVVPGCEQASQDLASCAQLCAQADDGNPCTEDLCDCTLQSCNPETAISHVPVAEGTACADADKCNGEEACDAQGACKLGLPVVVDDGNPCTIDACDPPTGLLSHAPAPQGTPCLDADVCNGEELCDGAGTCAPGVPLAVDDGNPCTADGCDPLLGVSHTPSAPGTACADADQCNGAEICGPGGECLPGGPPTVDDGNPCTVDGCDPLAGVYHQPAAPGTPCPDGDLCNGLELCDGAGTCTAGVPLPVDDGNACTTDTCDPLLGVRHTPTPEGAPCSDSDPCNGEESCDALGKCLAGTPVPVDDGNPCTVDACDPATGNVTHAPAAPGTPCADNNLCNGQEICDGAGLCAAGSPPLVDDGNDCTADTCDPNYGVEHFPLPAGSPCGAGNVCDGLGSCSTGPPEPGIVAPPLDATRFSFFRDHSFLFSGPGAVQTGALPEAFAPRRAAVLRGLVTSCDGAPLGGVQVRVAEHPELGSTLSRPNGMFDLMVNGGGPLVVRYEAPGYLPVDRHVTPPWQDFSMLPDVVLTPYDPMVGTIELGASTPEFQIAVGSAVADQDGQRQVMLLFAPGTTAQMVMDPGGSVTYPLTTLHVRGTEYTVGSCGPKAMPAELPPQSAYTYAVDLSVEEAVQAGALRVDFNQPVLMYVDNFLGLPVGTPVPTGYYQRTNGCWTPSPSGRVILIVAIWGGRAELDIDGDGVAEDASELEAIGITEAERAELVQHHAVGRTLWRVPLMHFTPLDCNYGWVPAGPGPGEDPDDPVDDPNVSTVSLLGWVNEPCEVEGACTIDVNHTVLQQSFELPGAPYQLHYRSDRVPGFTGARVTIPLTGPNPSANLKRVDLEIDVAGRQFAHSFSPRPSQQIDFAWDGLDAYGRRTSGLHPLTTRLYYVYDTTYAAVDPFGNFGDQPGLALVPARAEYALSRSWSGYIGRSETVKQLPGGISLDVHHSYDPRANVLYLGNGTQISFGDAAKEAQNALLRRGLGLTISTVAGTGEYGFSGDGGPASAAKLAVPSDVAIGPDGAAYIADADNCRVRKVDTSGTISTYIGSPQRYPLPYYYCDFPTDIQKHIGYPHSLALACDGSLFILSDYATGGGVGDTILLRYRPGQPLERWAGGGGPLASCADESPDGTPALDVDLCLGGIYGLTITAGPDCSVYFSDTWATVMRIGPDRRLYRVAGTPNIQGFSGDGGPARLAQLRSPMDIALDGQGGLYIADEGNSRVRHVSSSGTIATVAGTGTYNWLQGDAGDGGHARDATVHARYLAVGLDGSVWLNGWAPPSGTFSFGVFRRVDPQGIITRAAGYSGPILEACQRDGCPALRHRFSDSRGNFAFGADGRLYLVDGSASRVWAIAPPRPESHSEVVFPSRDGRQYYVFSEVTDRHVRTHDALTNVVLRTFGYDSDGLLVTIRDVDGRVTTIERDENGVPTSIRSPSGLATQLGYDELGGVASITNPAGETVSMTYYPGGLLKSRTLPRGNSYSYGYDDAGALISAEDSAGGFQTFQRQQWPAEYKESVTVTTALGRKSVYDLLPAPEGLRQRVTAPDGLTAAATFAKDATVVTELADGTSIALTRAPDPRFGILAPLAETVTVKTGGKTFNVKTARSVSLAVAHDPLSLKTLTETETVNGKTFTALFDGTGPAPRITRTTPTGRKTLVELNAVGRPTRIEVQGVLPTEFAYYDIWEPEHLKGRLKSTTQGGRKYEYFYDALGQIETIKAPLGKVVQFTHDAVGRVTSKTFPDGERVRFVYDENGNLTKLAQPGAPPAFEPEQVHRFGYEPRDLVASYTAPSIGLPGHQTLLDYSLDSELELVTRPDLLTVDPAHDDAGRLAKLALPSGLLQYSYFSKYAATPGKLQRIAASPDGVTLGVCRRKRARNGPSYRNRSLYSDAGTEQFRALSFFSDRLLDFTYSGSLVESIRWSGPVSGKLALAYNDDLRVTDEQLGWNVISYGYGEPDGLLTQAGALSITRVSATGLVAATSLGSIADTFTYDGYAELTGHVAARSGSPFYDARYTYDDLGRIVLSTELVLGATVGREYRYDDAGHLAEVYEGNGSCDQVSCALAAQYGYDANGNRTQVSLSGESIAATYDAQDRLLAHGSTSYGYTAAGELSYKTGPSGATSYNYDVLGNLRAVSLPTGTSIQYLVDGLNRRVGKKVGGVLKKGWLYGGGIGPTAELKANGYEVESRFVYGTKAHVPDYLVKGFTAYRMVTDHLGSVRLVVDPAGNVVQRLDYDAWGNVLVDTNPGFQPFGFAGGLYDPDTRLVRFGARDYDPEVGRWTAKDPILFAGGLNVYAYNRSDPVNRIDPRGLTPAVFALGAVLGGSIGIIYYASTVDIGDASVDGFVGAWGWGALGGALLGELGWWAGGATLGLGSLSGLSGGAIVAAAKAKVCGTGVNQVTDAVRQWLGPNYRVITNKAGDKIFLSQDGLRKVRFDMLRTGAHLSPHAHVEELINGAWVNSGQIYPTDVPPY